MKELSLHILDIVQNSIHAKASEIEISVVESQVTNLLSITITDNGCGMSEEQINSTLDPFFTTKKKKTGLGIPLFKQHAEMTGGNLKIKSEVGKGTRLTAEFTLNNIDRQPMGDITQTVVGLIRSNPEINYIFKHQIDDKYFGINLKEIKEELQGVPIDSPEVLGFLKEMIEGNLKEIGAI